MKKHFKFLMLALLALMPFALISCGSDDDDDNPSSSNTIQINVGVFNQVGNTKDSWFYQFSYTDSEKPKVGDDFSKKSLELWAQDESDACYTTLTYKSGSAKVVSIDKSKDDMTIKFDNLKMAGGEYSYTFNGTATVDFNFAR